MKNKMTNDEAINPHLEILAAVEAGYGGMDTRTGFLVDRRDFPNAIPIPENSLLNVPKPKTDTPAEQPAEEE